MLILRAARLVIFLMHFETIFDYLYAPLMLRYAAAAALVMPMLLLDILRRCQRICFLRFMPDDE